MMMGKRMILDEEAEDGEMRPVSLNVDVSRIRTLRVRRQQQPQVRIQSAISMRKIYRIGKSMRCIQSARIAA